MSIARCVRRLTVGLVWLATLVVQADSVVVFNEIHYHPVTNESQLEWIELQNQHTVDIDVSGWALAGGVRFTFPEGTVVAGGGFVVVAASPSDFAAQYPGVTALGPFQGRLGNSGEHLELRNNNARLMDEITYGAEDPWPVGADGAGPTLARRRPRTASGDPSNWTASAQSGGTPGRANFAKVTPVVQTLPVLGSTSAWRYHDLGVDWGDAWRSPDFDDSSWKVGSGVFTVGSQMQLPGGTPGTTIEPNRSTYYFRARFRTEAEYAQLQWSLRSLVDDGAVLYLNGEELQRVNLPSGAITFSTLASAQVGIPEWSDPLGIPPASLRNGENLLAVELHPVRKGASYAQTVLDSGPIGFWRLGEKSTRAVDASSRGGFQDGTYTRLLSSNQAQPGPRPTNSVAGRPLLGFESNNPAPRFAGNADGGNDLVLIPDSGSLDFSVSRSFSLEAWVRGATSQESGAAIVAKGSGGGGEQYAVDVVDGKYRFFSWSGAVPNTPSVVTATLGPDGSWQHVVAVFDGASGIMQLLVNGVETGRGTAPASIVVTSHDVSIGSRQTTDGNYDLNFDGWIDEVAIYDRALTVSEIQSHFESAFRSSADTPNAPEDAVFALELTTRRILDPDPEPQVSWNEVSAGSTNSFWVELINAGSRSVNLGGYSVARFGPGGRQELRLAEAELSPGGLVHLDQAMLGFFATEADRLVLYGAGGSNVVDAVVVRSRLQGRGPDGAGSWLLPSEATPGRSNVFALHSEVVINEIQYHRHPVSARPAQVTNLLTLPFGQSWRYHAEGRDLGSVWREPGYDDSAWPVGSGAFHAPAGATLPIPKGTFIPLALGTTNRLVTAYFRTQFELSGDPGGLVLALQSVVDDGAVIYLNGSEILRLNLPSGPISYGSLASSTVGPLTRPTEQVVPGTALRSGLNTLAVEVHQVTTNSTDFAFALEVSVGRLLAAATQFAESDDQWIELHNRSDSAVALGGWRLAGGIDYEFPAQATLPAQGFAVVARNPELFRQLYPEVNPYGPFTGRLSHRSEALVLRDPQGNPADQLTYFDGGRWPAEADGGGSTLELRDPRSDNHSAEAWGPSDETTKSGWRTYRWRGVALPGQQGEPDLWKEFALGLIDGAGEVEVDDVSVVEAPAAAAKQLISNGRFEGGSAARWRFLGNHRHSLVVPDPFEPGNFVLRIVSTGASEYQGNQIECTLTNNTSIVNGREYEISFRARWRSGANLLNARLYFNRLARTFALDRSERPGTPGARNSIWVENIGPTYEGLAQYPVVPESGQPVKVSIRAQDPDGLDSLRLRFAMGGGSWQEVAMLNSAGNEFQALIPGQKAGAVVQFYIVGRDRLGAESMFPAAGPNSRALYAVRDNQILSARLQQLRVIMTPADATYLHTPTNTLSNELLPATVVANEEDPYYDVGVRLKGSFVGRNVPRVGFHLGFHAEQPFRGVHGVISVDRSQHALTGGVGEIVAKHVATRAGGIPGMYDDIEQFLAPLPSYSLTAGIRLSGYDNDWLDSQYPNGSGGALYEVEVHRWNLATVDGKPESPKAVGNEGSGTGYANFEMEDFGDFADTYRWNYLEVNNRARDDYRGIIAAAKVLGLSGAAFEAAAPSVLDVDAWLRVMAYQQLVGPADAYFTGGAVHNYRVYVRPDDQGVLYMPWDWDSSFMASTDATLNGSGNIGKLLNSPGHRRAYYEHLHDIITTAFNAAYIERWTTHYGSLAQQNMGEILTYIRARSSTVLSQLPRTNAFRVTLNGGAGFATNATEVILTGTAPITVRSILVNGQPALLSWTSPSAWRLTVGLAAGENGIELTGLDRTGQLLTNALARLTITNTGPGALLPVVINEWMADNAGPDGIADPADGLFQDWFELFNPNPLPVDLSGYYLTDTLSVPTKWKIPQGTSLAGRGYLLVWADNQPQQNGPAAQGDLHAGFQLSADGEGIGLFGPDGASVQSSVTFGRQLQNLTQGRSPDGVVSPIVFLSTPTPRRSNSGPRALRITVATAESGQVRVRWSSEPARTYRLEASSAVAGEKWEILTRLVGGAQPELEYSDTAPRAGSRFYRVALE